MPVFLLDKTVVFPDPEKSDPGGLLAVGGDLSTERLLLAYRMGIFPWYSEDQPILWFSPDTRLVFFPENFKASGSLKKVIKTCKYEIRVDTNFNNVIESCSNIDRKDQDGTWITEDMKKAYKKLYSLGYAHSFESYLDGELVGGLYGISLGRAFFGESMFHTESDASKAAFYYLVEFCKQNKFDFIDSQVPTEHMLRMGGVEIRRRKFLDMLRKTLSKETLKGHWNLNNADSLIKNS